LGSLNLVLSHHTKLAQNTQVHEFKFEFKLSQTNSISNSEFSLENSDKGPTSELRISKSIEFQPSSFNESYRSMYPLKLCF